MINFYANCRIVFLYYALREGKFPILMHNNFNNVLKDSLKFKKYR